MARRRELDYMNGAACLLVILIHVLSLGISSADPRSWQAAVIYLPWRLASFVVPMFLYTGAVKLVLKFGDTPITPGLWLRYFGQRLRKIYLPYVLWVVIYYACFLPIHYVLGTPEEFFSYLLLGTLSAPFYYIIIVMQFYFLMPLWMWVVRRLPAYLSLGLSLLVMFVMQQFSYLLSLGGVDFPYADRIFPTYLLYWVAGLYVGRHYDRAVRTLDRPAGQGLCLAGAVLCALVMGDISPTAPGVLLATMLCTGLSPIAGQFGWYWGVAAGFLRMAIVQHTSFLHGGMNLYNNGFAAGLTCVLMIPIIEAVRPEPKE